MSYRSFKRVVGETSLERKCRFLFGACLLILITGSFYAYGRQTEQLVYKQNPIRGRLIVNTILVLLHWEKFEQSTEFKPYIQEWFHDSNVSKYEWNLIRPNGDIVLSDGTVVKTDGTVMDPGHPNIRSRSAKTHIPRLDDFERKFLRRVEQLTPLPEPKPGGEEVNEEQTTVWDFRFVVDDVVEKDEKVEKYEYLQAVGAAHSCVGCHKTFPEPRDDLRNGDLLAVAKVRFSNEETQKAINLNRGVLLTLAIVTVFLAMVASWVIVRYVIAKPLKHLREVSDEISRGDLTQRADIHTGDEFEALATAFNRMLRGILDTQGELRQSNTALDAKVDELAQANMRLFEMNRLKGDFLATMSHELRTPLNSIIGFSDVLGSIASLNDKQKRYVQNIQKSGKVLLDMINDILDLAKIESGKMEVRPAEFNVEELVQAQCDTIRPLSEKKNIDVAVDVTPCAEPLEQDLGKMQQILNNLLSNAVKFTPEGGRIRVAARKNAAGNLELTVADTGVGIAPEDQAAIFEKFRQGSAVVGGDAMTREHTGTGLGLSIVKELCKLLGGEVTLSSELGTGSQFTVRLPWRYEARHVELRLDDSLDGRSPAAVNGGETESPAPSTSLMEP